MGQTLLVTVASQFGGADYDKSIFGVIGGDPRPLNGRKIQIIPKKRTFGNIPKVRFWGIFCIFLPFRGLGSPPVTPKILSS